MRQEAPGFDLVMLFFHSRQKLLPGLLVAEEQAGGFGKGPLEVRLPHLVAGGSRACACKLLAALH